MDRDDEKKDSYDTDEVGARHGDVIGLNGSSVPNVPGDRTASNDPADIRKRRPRAEESEADDRRDDDRYRQSTGATGIDMGAGGRGTDVSGE
jgi:hypothetical protein